MTLTYVPSAFGFDIDHNFETEFWAFITPLIQNGLIILKYEHNGPAGGNPSVYLLPDNLDQFNAIKQFV